MGEFYTAHLENEIESLRAQINERGEPHTAESGCEAWLVAVEGANHYAIWRLDRRRCRARLDTHSPLPLLRRARFAAASLKICKPQNKRARITCGSPKRRLMELRSELEDIGAIKHAQALGKIIGQLEAWQHRRP